MASSENDDVIQAFAPGTANESFANRILQGRLNRCAQYFHTCTLRNAIELSSELVVIIANDELGPLAEWRDVPKLLSCPFSGWRASDTNVHNSPRIDVDHEECEDRPEPDIVGLQEVASPNRMVLQECAPSLSVREFRWSGPGHISLNRALRDSDAEFQEFAAYSLRAPQDIFSGHAADECDDLWVNSGSTALAFRDLKRQKSRNPSRCQRSTVSGFTNSRAFRQCGRRLASRTTKPRSRGLENRTFDLPRRDNELLTEQGVLHQQLGPRACGVSNKASEHWEGSAGFSNRCSNSIE